MDSFDAYPISFTPILKDKIWGGTKLQTELNKVIPTETTGESWEISTVSGNTSVVENGVYKGTNLNDLIKLNPDAVLGTKIHKQFGFEFPLLFKFLDAKQDLSIQVHPNDALAKERHKSFGKTEMWYVMQADENAKLIIGFKENTEKEDFLQSVKNNTVIELLDEIKPKSGDVFYLATGTVHAICGGIVIAEIQQTSDVTYRIYDFDRLDDNGKKRELHLDYALEAINYKPLETKREYDHYINKINIAVDSPYFVTSVILLSGRMKMIQNHERFSVLMCVDDGFSIHFKDQEYKYKKGQTVYIPAMMDNYEIEGDGKVLEIHI